MRFAYSLLCSLFLMLGSFTAEASHLIGGDIYYRYVGNEPGRGVNDYEITLVLYWESNGGFDPGAAANIAVNGLNCSFSLSTSLPRVSGPIAGSNFGAFDCIDPSPSLPSPMVNVYRGVVTLSSTCQRVRISHQTCDRPYNYTNLPQPPTYMCFYFEAMLDRRLGENSSPVFLNDPICYVCNGAFQVYQQNAVETDGDSLSYELVPPLTNVGVVAPYNGGFSYLQPITTDPAYPMHLDSVTGTMTFMASTPSAFEISTMALIVREYRYDTVLQFWENVGYNFREIEIVVAQTCNSTVNEGVKLDPNAPGTYLDSLGRQVRDYNCLDSSVVLTFSIPIECYTMAADGTDFRLTAPNGQPIPIESIEGFCDVNGETDSVKINLHKPLLFNGDYYLYSKVGTDGNTLLNKCGKGLDEFDTIILRVEGCVDPEYEVTHVSVEEDKRNRIHFTVDTIKMPLKYIDFMRVYASADSGATYKAVGNVHMEDSLVLVARDGSPGTEGVDRQYYYYRIQMIAGGQELHVSNDYHTIHLSGDLQNPQSMPLRWSAFAGPSYPFYNDVRFTVQWGPETDSGEYDFRNVNDPIFPTPDSSYTLALPDETPGNYAIRVLTNQDPNGYISESNWIVYNIPQVVPPPPPPPIGAVPVIIPNAFTPSGDNINDEWTIENIESWSSRKVSIFNRWGRMVWSTDEYNNAQAFDGTDNSGSRLPDGVYMYVVELAHGPTSQSEVHNGTLHLVTNQ